MNENSPTLLHRISILVPYLYIAGIVFIVMYTFYLWFEHVIYTNNYSVDVKPTIGPYTPGVSQTTWLEVVIKPIIGDPLVRTIFKGLFLLIVWVCLFLVIRVGLYNLRRFKFFNLEFEVEKQTIQTSIHELIQVHEGKTDLMVNLTTQETKDKLTIYLDENDNINLNEALKYFLNEVQLNYKSNFGHHFSWDVYWVSKKGKIIGDEVDLQPEAEDIIKVAYESQKPQFYKKGDNIFKKNYLACTYNYNKQDYCILLSSFTHEFSYMDTKLIESLINVLITYSENIEYILLSDKLKGQLDT